MSKFFSLLVLSLTIFVAASTGCNSEPPPVVETQPTSEEEAASNMEAAKVTDVNPE